MMSIEQMAVAGRQPSIDRCESSRRRQADWRPATSEGGAIRAEAGAPSPAQSKSHPIKPGGMGQVVSRLAGCSATDRLAKLTYLATTGEQAQKSSHRARPAARMTRLLPMRLHQLASARVLWGVWAH